MGVVLLCQFCANVPFRCFLSLSGLDLLAVRLALLIQYLSILFQAKHADASKVLEYSVANFSNAQQRQAMVEEFYGPSYAFHKAPEYNTLEELLKAKPEAQNSILDFMKVIISR